MPATPFIFEYFLYNSIYQYDWKRTDQNSTLLVHPRNQNGHPRLREWEQQDKLLEYLQERSTENPRIIQRAFAPFKFLDDLEGQWTEIDSDNILSEDDGRKFFGAVRELKAILLTGISEDVIEVFFENLKTCREFVGKVRNNIFHGAKSLSQIWSEHQRRRIELYHLLIQSLNSLFFLTREHIDSVASDRVISPVYLPSGSEKDTLLSTEILELQLEGLMKQEDSTLIAWANELLAPLRNAGEPSGALFYPSAGCDIITPFLIGLPFCSEFYFYDKGSASGWEKALKRLREILGNPSGFIVPKIPTRSFEIEFEYAGVKRRIFHRKADNEEFLKTSSRLSFFFHRGDSMGEGGADQPWDGAWFERWQKMIPEGESCAVLSDGIPYGFHKNLASRLTKHETLCRTPHSGPYHCGIIHHNH